MTNSKSFWKNTRGDAVVEATILFPIIIMIFAGLMLLAVYLPTRGLLQRATQYTATALATECSDTWLRCNEKTGNYYCVKDRSELGTVYGTLLGSLTGNKRHEADNAEQLVKLIENNGAIHPKGNLTVEYGVVNYVIYKEIIVTATKTVELPIDLSFVGLSNEIPITVTSAAVVQNGDEFIRNMDLATDFVEYIADKYNLNQVFDSVGKLFNKFNTLLGI